MLATCRQACCPGCRSPASHTPLGLLSPCLPARRPVRRHSWQRQGRQRGGSAPSSAVPAVTSSQGDVDDANGSGESSRTGSNGSATTSSGQDAWEPIKPEDFSIIEGMDSVKDFEALQLDEIKHGIQGRRNRIFLLMEEVRRLRIQQRLKGGHHSMEQDLQEESYPAAVPFLPARTDAIMRVYWRFYVSAVATLILFGAVLAPILEVRLGLGGTSYADFINKMRLPPQLAAVDPIVASFCGGAVGVLTTLLVVELNNSSQQAKNRCIYCGGAGYLTCGSCGGVGVTAGATASSDSIGDRCASCSGTGKVMCIGCLCTGKKVAHEHDPRLDPFS